MSVKTLCSLMLFAACSFQLAKAQEKTASAKIIKTDPVKTNTQPLILCPPSANQPQPLFIVDGKAISSEALRTLSPDAIQDIRIVKEATEAVALYGDAAKNGVVIIRMKENATLKNTTNTTPPKTEVQKSNGNGIPNIIIRGAGTSTAEPLMIIDGETADSAQMNALKPDKIESVTVLKDAGAIALYGADAINGVILVTTKKERK